jgi:hypothetical protein
MMAFRPTGRNGSNRAGGRPTSRRFGLWSETETGKGDFWRGSDFPEDTDRGTLTITDIVMRTVTLDFKTERKGERECLVFKEDSRLLEVKPSIGKKLVKILGASMDDWIGQCITLGGLDYNVGRGIELYPARGRPRYDVLTEPAGNMAADPEGEQEDLEEYEDEDPHTETATEEAYVDEPPPPPPPPRAPPRPQQPAAQRPQQPPPQRPPQRR